LVPPTSSVDRDGGITIVECKLAANAEIRRWVIGQAFSYAAGLWQLSYEDLERAFSARGAKLAASFDGKAAWDPATFREAVEANLQRGAFRLVIAVDQITQELKRTVVYINRHTTTELRLLALELRHAADGGTEILLPEVYGEESAEEPTRPRRRWDEPSLIEGLREEPPELADRMIRLYESLRDGGARASWGTGAKSSVTMSLGRGPRARFRSACTPPDPTGLEEWRSTSTLSATSAPRRRWLGSPPSYEKFPALPPTWRALRRRTGACTGAWNRADPCLRGGARCVQARGPRGRQATTHVAVRSCISASYRRIDHGGARRGQLPLRAPVARDTAPADSCLRET
jgi:hypothetical protein